MNQMKWWLAESNKSNLYVYEFYVNHAKVAYYYSGYVNKDKIKNTNLFEINNFELKKLGLDYRFVKKIMDLFDYECECDYELVFINEEKKILRVL